MKLRLEPLTTDNLPDLALLFSRPGLSVARGCWCMYYRRTGSSPPPAGMNRSEHNRRDFEALVETGRVPGLIGYENGKPIGWVSLGPREDYAKLERSPVMKPVDDKPVWSIVCFVVDPAERHRGVAQALLEGALDWARANGVRLIEGYPFDRTDRPSDDSMWFGTKSMFDRAGFVEAARRKPLRPLMRKALSARRARPRSPD